MDEVCGGGGVWWCVSVCNFTSSFNTANGRPRVTCGCACLGERLSVCTGDEAAGEDSDSDSQGGFWVTIGTQEAGVCG